MQANVKPVPDQQEKDDAYTLEVLSPVADVDNAVTPPSARIDALNGKIIGLAWNRKPGGNIARERVRLRLQERFPDAKFLLFDDDIPFAPETIERIVEQCDAVVGTTADCGACSSWLAHDMIQIEKGGVPVVMITARAFVDDAGMSMVAYGMPDLPTAIFEGVEFTSTGEEEIVKLVEPIIDDIVDKLTKENTTPMAPTHRPAAEGDWAECENFSGGDSLSAWRKFNEEFLSRGWGDGFPLFPPTREAVKWMLSGTKRDPKEIIVRMVPAFGLATVEKIAICCVMAGCEPGHLPVLIAAVQAMDDPKFWLRNVAVSTSPHSPMIVINGPIVQKLGVNSKRCALGPGEPSRVNTAIGRALRLIMMNIGHAYPGTLDMDTIGSPCKYSMCLAENEEDSPWESLAVERGFRKDQSVVTMFSVESLMEVYDLKNHTAEGIMDSYAGTVNSLGSTHSRQWMYPRRYAHNSILLSPTHARQIAAQGWAREDVRRYLYEKARIPAKQLQGILDRDRIMKSMRWVLDVPPDTLLPITGGYDWFHVIVVGGPVGKSSFTSGHGQCVSRLIEDQD
jgi:hypothetical protein